MSTPSHLASVSNQAMLSLDGFFTRLQDAGFFLRPDDYAEIVQVITTFSPKTPDELAELIAPLLVTSEEEQHRFYALFAEYQRTGATVVVESSDPLSFWQYLRRLGWYWLILVVILLASILTGDQVLQTPATPKPLLDTTQPTRPIASSAKPLSRYLSILSSTGPIGQVSKLNLYYVGIPGLLALLCIGGSLYMLQRARRPTQQPAAPTNRFASQRPPFILPLPNRESELVLPNRAFTEFVTTLRQRSEDERSALNITQTLSATVRSGGLPSLIFSHRLREEEFLFLIDNSRIRGQQLHLFDFLYRALSRESVCVERFFYQVPFGQFYNERFPNGLNLTELANRYQTSTLVIWGTGYPLLFDEYDVIDPVFLRALRRWEHRAILTPLPFPDWDYRERALQSEFLVLPADVAGQLRLMQAFHDNQLDQTAYLQTRTDLYSTADIDFKNVTELQDYLGDDLFQWLCATAVYGKVRWEVLIEMGRAVLTDPYDLSITNLLKLTRISWLRDGTFPDAIRLELLKALQPVNELKTRETLLKLLYYADVNYPDGYFFDEERHLLRTTNQFVLFSHQPDQYPDYAPAAEEYTQLWHDQQLPDGTIRLYLENPAKSWDNLLGTGSSRVRLADQLSRSAVPIRRPSNRLWYVLALELGQVLAGYIGYILWQKPPFALVDEPVTYTFVFRPNSCMTLADFKASRVTLRSSSIRQTLVFKDTTATVSLSGDERKLNLAFLDIETPFHNTATFPLAEQRHTFEVQGEHCGSSEMVYVTIYFSQDSQHPLIQSLVNEIDTMKTADNWKLKAEAVKLNYENDQFTRILYEQDDLKPLATKLVNTVFNFGYKARAQDRQGRILDFIPKGSGKSIEIVLTTPRTFAPCPPHCSDPDKPVSPTQDYATNNAGQRIVVKESANVVQKNPKSAQGKLPVVVDNQGNVAQTANVNKASDTSKPSTEVSRQGNKFVFDTGKPIRSLSSAAEKNSLQNGVVVPGAPWVLADILQFDENQEGAYALAAATSPSTYQSSEYTAYLLPMGGISQKDPINPDGMYSALITYLRGRLSTQNINVIQIQTLAQLPAYQDPLSIKSLLNAQQSQTSIKPSVWVIIMASVIDNR